MEQLQHLNVLQISAFPIPKTYFVLEIFRNMNYNFVVKPLDAKVVLQGFSQDPMETTIIVSHAPQAVIAGQ